MATKKEAFYNCVERDVCDPMKSWDDIVANMEAMEDD